MHVRLQHAEAGSQGRSRVRRQRASYREFNSQSARRSFRLEFFGLSPCCILQNFRPSTLFSPYLLRITFYLEKSREKKNITFSHQFTADCNCYMSSLSAQKREKKGEYAPKVSVVSTNLNLRTELNNLRLANGS